MPLSARRVALFIAATLTTPALAADPGPAGLPLPLQCYGGEPFWSLTLRDAKTATFKSDVDDATWTIKTIGNAMLRPTTWRVVFAGTNRRAFIFDEGQHACSDSDGDRPFAYGVLVENGEGLLRGCCDPAR